jgi:hypothetical protein
MRRAALIAVVLAVSAPAVARAQAPSLRAKLAACQSGPQPADRTATFTGSMPKIKGTKRMWMRFDLQQLIPPATAYATVKAPGLGVWQKSASTTPSSGFVFTQRVQALSAPGTYKAVVRFRWYGKDGKLLHTAKRTTPACRQPDQRPDLRAGELTAWPGPLPDQATYMLAVRNDGRGDAGPFDVGLSVGGIDQPAQRMLSGLDAGTEDTVTFVAPRCAPGSTLRFTLDSRGEVAEASEADDVVLQACPFTA